MAKQTEEEKQRKKDEREATSIAIADRREKVIALHLSGAGVRAIAEHLTRSGAPVSKSTVQTDINAMLDEKNKDLGKKVARIRALNERRLNALILAHWGAAQSGDVKKTYLVRTLMKDLSELYGADAPVKVEQSGSITVKKAVDLTGYTKDDLLAMEEILKKNNAA